MSKIGSLSNNKGDGYGNGTQKMNSRYFKLRLFQLSQFFQTALIPTLSIHQMLAIFFFLLEMNSKRLYQSSAKEKESRCLVFTSSTEHEIRHFPVVVVQRRQGNVQKSVMHVQSCCFANLHLLRFCRSRCRHRRRCLSSL